jgi:hypothetical protein
VSLSAPSFGRLTLVPSGGGRGRRPVRSLRCVSDRRNRRTDKLVGPAEDQTFLSILEPAVRPGGATWFRMARCHTSSRLGVGPPIVGRARTARTDASLGTGEVLWAVTVGQKMPRPAEGTKLSPHRSSSTKMFVPVVSGRPRSPAPDREFSPMNIGHSVRGTPWPSRGAALALSTSGLRARICCVPGRLSPRR